jgi:tetratricopeptide (TPR) repeat protein
MRLGRAYAALGRYAEASAAMERAISLDKDIRDLKYLGEVYARWGKPEKALRQISELKKMGNQGSSVSTEIAAIYAQLGNNDAALDWLAKAPPEDAHLISDPVFDGLRSDPRFQRVDARLRPDPACPSF